MRQLIVVGVALLGLVLGGFAVATAQDPGRETNAAGTPCPEPGASPAASPMASPTAMASPMAGMAMEGTPTGVEGCPPASGAVAVEIQDFAYHPDPVTVSVGTEVTWTNRDTVPHTATAQGRDVLQSGTIDPDASYETTFDTAGTYEYFCEFHPNMHGTLVVE